MSFELIRVPESADSSPEARFLRAVRRLSELQAAVDRRLEVLSQHEPARKLLEEVQALNASMMMRLSNFTTEGPSLKIGSFRSSVRQLIDNEPAQTALDKASDEKLVRMSRKLNSRLHARTGNEPPEQVASFRAVREAVKARNLPVVTAYFLSIFASEADRDVLALDKAASAAEQSLDVFVSKPSFEVLRTNIVHGSARATEQLCQHLSASLNRLRLREATYVPEVTHEPESQTDG